MIHLCEREKSSAQHCLEIAVPLCPGIIAWINELSFRPKHRFIHLCKCIDLRSGNATALVRRSSIAQQSFRPENTFVWFRDNTVFYTIQTIALVQDFLRDDWPERSRDEAVARIRVRRADVAPDHPAPALQMIEVGSRRPGDDTVEVFGKQKDRLDALSASGGATEVVRLVLRAVVVSFYNLLPEDSFDVDSAKRKVVDDFRVVEKDNAAIPVMTVVGTNGSKVKSASVVQIRIVDACARVRGKFKTIRHDTDLHPPSPPLPTAKNRPYHVSGSHTSKCTAESSVVFTTA
jgi:hypothetical protein